jgi:hypothetical protein
MFRGVVERVPKMPVGAETVPVKVPEAKFEAPATFNVVAFTVGAVIGTYDVTTVEAISMRSTAAAEKPIDPGNLRYMPVFAALAKLYAGNVSVPSIARNSSEKVRFPLKEMSPFTVKSLLMITPPASAPIVAFPPKSKRYPGCSLIRIVL